MSNNKKPPAFIIPPTAVAAAKKDYEALKTFNRHLGEFDAFIGDDPAYAAMLAPLQELQVMTVLCAALLTTMFNHEKG